MSTTRFCGGIWSQGDMVPGGMVLEVWSQGVWSLRGTVREGGTSPLPCEQIDRHLWKHYLPEYLLAGGNKLSMI